MKLKKYSICPNCFEIIEYFTGMVLPYCDDCSSKNGSIKVSFIELELKESLLLNILVELEYIKRGTVNVK